jgi:hypothetical protein
LANVNSLTDDTKIALVVIDVYQLGWIQSSPRQVKSSPGKSKVARGNSKVARGKSKVAWGKVVFGCLKWKFKSFRNSINRNPNANHV